MDGTLPIGHRLPAQSQPQGSPPGLRGIERVPISGRGGPEEGLWDSIKTRKGWTIDDMLSSLVMHPGKMDTTIRPFLNGH
jgi:hypothetical protein